jgi:acyl-CoA thioesterase-2
MNDSLDVDAVIAETLAFLTLRPDAEDAGSWVGDAPEWFGPVLFGGFPIAQAIMAATRDAPEGRRFHSMHAYFLRPVLAAQPISYRVRPIREGRSFTSRGVEAFQDGKQTMAMACSFTEDTDGYVYDVPARNDYPNVADVEKEQGPGPWLAGFVGPTEPRADGTRDSTHRIWFRIPAELPDDETLHTALVGFATDWTGIGGRPLHLDGDTQGMVSLDHAAWVHRPVRVDSWLFYDVESLVNAGGRGLLRGVMRDEAGRVVVSVAQEMRLAVLG